jgi:plasmid stabilization system protein ParE
LQYRVDISDLAVQEAEKYADYICSRSNDGEASIRWWNGLLDAIYSLETFPSRHPLIRRRNKSQPDRHQLVYHSHRILYEISGEVVTVVREYHGARRTLRS